MEAIQVNNSIIRTRVYVIMDQSGSMYTIHRQAVSFFNEQLAALNESMVMDARNEITISMIPFASEVREPLIWNRPITEVNPLTPMDYPTNGSTALNDAIGITIKRIEAEGIPEDTAVLMLILTDGEENCSQMYTKAQIASMIKEVQISGRWTVVFMGGDQDVDTAIKSYSLAQGNVMAFAATQKGMDSLGMTTRVATQSYMKERSLGMMASTAYYSGNSNTSLDSDNDTK